MIGALNYLSGKGLQRLLVPALQRRRRRRQRLAIRRARRQVPLRLLETRPVGHRLRPRHQRRGCTCTSNAGDRDRRQCPRRPQRPQDRQGADLARRRRPRPGAEALLPRADRPLRPQPRAQLEPRRGEHPDHRSSRRTWRRYIHDTRSLRPPHRASTPSPTSRTKSTARCSATPPSCAAPPCRTATSKTATRRWSNGRANLPPRANRG